MQCKIHEVSMGKMLSKKCQNKCTFILEHRATASPKLYINLFTLFLEAVSDKTKYLDVT